jgi:tRNA(adenine34) deaminase
MNFSEQDHQWMRHALELAKMAELNNEVPIGAVLISENKIIGEGSNSPITHHDPTAHAEIMALRAGAKNIGNYRLVDTTLYVTLEPCAMCVGAIVHARVKRVVFGAFDPKSGAVSSVFELGENEKFNHRVQYEGGLLAEPCGVLLKDFFRAKR